MEIETLNRRNNLQQLQCEKFPITFPVSTASEAEQTTLKGCVQLVVHQQRSVASPATFTLPSAPPFYYLHHSVLASAQTKV